MNNIGQPSIQIRLLQHLINPNEIIDIQDINSNSIFNNRNQYDHLIPLIRNNCIIIDDPTFNDDQNCSICLDSFNHRHNHSSNNTNNSEESEESESTNTNTPQTDNTNEPRKICQLPCKHVFHFNCVCTHFITSKATLCPMCRTDITNYNGSISDKYTFNGIVPSENDITTIISDVLQNNNISNNINGTMQGTNNMQASLDNIVDNIIGNLNQNTPNTIQLPITSQLNNNLPLNNQTENQSNQDNFVNENQNENQNENEEMEGTENESSSENNQNTNNNNNNNNNNNVPANNVTQPINNQTNTGTRRSNTNRYRLNFLNDILSAALRENSQPSTIRIQYNMVENENEPQSARSQGTNRTSLNNVDVFNNETQSTSPQMQTNHETANTFNFEYPTQTQNNSQTQNNPQNEYQEQPFYQNNMHQPFINQQQTPNVQPMQPTQYRQTQEIQPIRIPIQVELNLSINQDNISQQRNPIYSTTTGFNQTNIPAYNYYPSNTIYNNQPNVDYSTYNPFNYYYSMYTNPYYTPYFTTNQTTVPNQTNNR